jgi:hypothetical protein
MSVRVCECPFDTEDFFTKLSFSALIGELGESDTFSPFPPSQQDLSNSIKIGRDLDRLWSNKSEQDLINLILM